MLLDRLDPLHFITNGTQGVLVWLHNEFGNTQKNLNRNVIKLNNCVINVNETSVKKGPKSKRLKSHTKISSLIIDL